MRTALARVVRVVVVAGLAGLVGAWFRRRSGDPFVSADGAAAWPPLEVEVPVSRVMEPSDGGAAEPADAGERTWVEPAPDGSCPLSHPVKAKTRSGIYHVPEGLSYGRTNADRCYPDAADAEGDGFRPAKM